MCDPAGVAEVAELLDVDRTTLWRLRGRQWDFPEPRWNLQTGPLWETAEIIRYLEAHPKRRRIICAEDDEDD